MALRGRGTPIGEIVRNLDSQKERFRIQAGRASPPAILQDKIVRTLSQGRTGRPRSVGADTSGVMAQAFTRGVLRMEIHMLIDKDDQPYGELGKDEPKWIPCPFNPEEIEHTIKVNWLEHNVPGRSGKPTHFVNTDNRKLRFTVEWDAFLFSNTKADFADSVSRLKYARKFLEALSVPPQGADSILGGSPPRVLFYWPNYMSLSCFIDSITIKDKRWAPDGELWGFSAAFEVKEVDDVRLTIQDALKNGLQRADEPRGQVGSAAGDPSASGGTRVT